VDRSDPSEEKGRFASKNLAGHRKRHNELFKEVKHTRELQLDADILSARVEKIHRHYASAEQVGSYGARLWCFRASSFDFVFVILCGIIDTGLISQP
jgi:hypothetical protein